jgi:stage V sporulation protein G
MYFALVRLVTWNGNGSLKAFCDLSVDRRLLIRGIRVVEGRQGPFVSMPRVKDRDQRWRDVVMPMTKETRMEMVHVILDAFYKSRQSSITKEVRDA